MLSFGDIVNERESGAPEEIRTPNLLIRSQVLYPVELRARAACTLLKSGKACKLILEFFFNNFKFF